MMTDFGKLSDGRQVHKVTISSDTLSVTLLTLGATVQDVRLAGTDRSLTLGSERVSDYENGMQHHGSLIGPVVNRISTANVRLDGMMYELERNQDGRIHLHSGSEGTHLQLWELIESDATSATFAIDLADGTCGLPGNRRVTACYRVTGEASLTLDITGTTDATTLMNFANHSYWNLDGTATYDGHILWIAADAYLPGTPDFTPTGEVVEVDGTDMDFRSPREVKAGIPAFDNNFCLSGASAPLRDVLRLTGRSGLSMTLATTCPGVQVYDARNARRPGRGAYEGLAIEAQHWPDAPNHRHFPSIKTTPDAPYRQTTRWTFAGPL